MATWTQIYDVEAALEDAFSAAFTTESITNATARETGALALPYVSIVATLGAATGRINSDGSIYRHDCWNFSVEIGVHTDRHVDTTTHSSYRALARKVMESIPNDPTTWNASKLPYHLIADLMHVSMEPGASDNDDVDTSILSYQGVVMVRPGISWGV